MSVKSEKSTINGFSTSVVRQMTSRRFKNYFDKVVHAGTRFDIYIYESVDQNRLDEFKEEWPEFKIILVATAEYKNQPFRK